MDAPRFWSPTWRVNVSDPKDPAAEPEYLPVVVNGVVIQLSVVEDVPANISSATTEPIGTVSWTSGWGRSNMGEIAHAWVEGAVKKFDGAYGDSVPLDSEQRAALERAAVRWKNRRALIEARKSLPLFSLPLERIHSAFARAGQASLFNQKKLSNVLTRYAFPYESYISVFRRGRLECKGTTTILAAYLAIELALARIADELAPSVRFFCTHPTIINIVSRCAMPMAIDPLDLKAVFPARLESPGNFMNHSVIHTNVANEQEQVRVSVSSKPTVVTVGAKYPSTIEWAYREIYRNLRVPPPANDAKRRKLNESADEQPRS